MRVEVVYKAGEQKFWSYQDAVDFCKSPDDVQVEYILIAFVDGKMKVFNLHNIPLTSIK